MTTVEYMQEEADDYEIIKPITLPDADAEHNAKTETEDRAQFGDHAEQRPCNSAEATTFDHGRHSLLS
jgi:hypothetical protein